MSAACAPLNCAATAAIGSGDMAEGGVAPNGITPTPEGVSDDADVGDEAFLEEEEEARFLSTSSRLLEAAAAFLAARLRSASAKLAVLAADVDAADDGCTVGVGRGFDEDDEEDVSVADVMAGAGDSEDVVDGEVGSAGGGGGGGILGGARPEKRKFYAR